MGEGHTLPWSLPQLNVGEETESLTQSPQSPASPSPGERLDLYLVRNGRAVSRRHARELIATGGVRVNGRRCRKGLNLAPSDLVEVESSGGAAAIVPNSDLPLRVLYHDAEILIADKPGLQPCHPLSADEGETLMNAVVARFPQAAEAGPKPLEGGLVHRLDNGTSGAVMVALTRAAFEYLRAALGNKQIARSYLALAQDKVEHPLELSAPIAHHPRNQRKMTVVHDPRIAAKLKARPAITAVKPIRKAGRFTLLEVRPRTGSRHQIRVHLADAGFPLAGDELYGGPKLASLPPGRFFLHLAELRIPRADGQGSSPDSDRSALIVTSPLPDDLRDCLAQQGK
jgi:23S rRNA pseudouridine1911/1915/1917 synthase